MHLWPRSLYWVSRYIERAENVARLINVNNMLMMDLPKGVSAGWEPLVDIIGARKAYLENGGVPFLDADYTVFGQVVEGLEVIDAIAKTATGAGDRPVEDVTMQIRVIN